VSRGLSGKPTDEAIEPILPYLVSVGSQSKFLHPPCGQIEATLASVRTSDTPPWVNTDPRRKASRASTPAIFSCRTTKILPSISLHTIVCGQLRCQPHTIVCQSKREAAVKMRVELAFGREIKKAREALKKSQ